MQLYTFPSSPFGCKVKAVIYACGQEKNIAIEEFHPWQTDSFFRDLNPLGKIPVLKISDSQAIYDSPVICEYIMEQSGKLNEFMPDKYKSLKVQALVDGMAEAAVSIRYERVFRPKHLQSIDWYDRQYMALNLGLKHLNDQCDSVLSQHLLFENLCVASFLSYVELRFPESDFQKDYKKLFAWYEKFIGTYPVLEAAKAKDKTPPSTIMRLEK